MLKQATAVVLIACATLAFAGVALAQDDAASTTAPQTQQTQVRSLVKQLRQKSAKLQQIHSQTLQADADLRQQQEQFVAMMRKEIKAQGYDLEAGRKRVQDMAGKLKNKDLSDADRKAVMQNIAGERQSLTQARSAALQESKVQQASKALQDATITAMKKQ